MKRLQRQKGFTLVELAIVLTIIGLLIGGILKGQALINNAKVTSQIAQLQAVEAAYTTFQSTYNALPGDMSSATTRLPNCTGTTVSNCYDGAGNGSIWTGTAANLALSNIATTAFVTANNGTITNDEPQFWSHLAYSGLISGVNATAVVPISAGGVFPAAKAGSGASLMVETFNAAPVAANPAWAGVYVVVLQNVLANPTTGVGAGALTPGAAAQIDRKTDDGIADSGSVQGYGVLLSCVTPATTNNNEGYLESSNSTDCDLAYQLN